MDIHTKRSLGEYLYTLIHSDFCGYIAECRVVEVDIFVKFKDSASLDSNAAATTTAITYVVEYYDGETLVRTPRQDSELFDNPDDVAASMADNKNINYLPNPEDTTV